MRLGQEGAITPSRGIAQKRGQKRILSCAFMRALFAPEERRVPMTRRALTLLAGAALCLVAAGTVASMAREQSPIRRRRAPSRPRPHLRSWDANPGTCWNASRCRSTSPPSIIGRITAARSIAVCCWFARRSPSCARRRACPTYRRRRLPDVRALYRHGRQDGHVFVDSEHCGNDELQGPQ